MRLAVRKAATFTQEFLDVGPDSKLSNIDVFSRPEGAPFTAGICEIWPGKPITFNPTDHSATYCMLEGSLTFADDQETWAFEPGDVAFAPQGSKFTLASDTYAKFFLVTYPHWR